MRRSFLVLLIFLPLAGCGDDDGADVRNVAEGSGSEGSGSGTAGSGSGSASGTAPAVCESVGDPEGSDANVVVTLDEWSVVPAQDAVDAGTVTFFNRNAGTEVHELVVVRATADTFDVQDGQVQEDALPEGSFIGEVEGFPAASTCDGTFELAAGDYTLFCNIVETEAGGAVESHYENGMSASFTVR